MVYTKPTLFGLAYAARLFRQVDYDLNFDKFRQAANPLDLTIPDHASLLRDWLNSWGCRIVKAKLPKFTRDAAKWARRWVETLPQQSLPSLTDVDMESVANAYSELRNEVMGPTAATKTLFALRPETAIPWDEPIRRSFNLSESKSSYHTMLQRSKDELAGLVANARTLGVPEPAIQDTVGSPGRTLVRLLDEYHWITITRGHDVPSVADLRLWLSWAGSTAAESDRQPLATKNNQ